MIQLSTLTATSPETPVKTVDAGASEAGFADVLAEQLGSAVAADGKTLPGGLPAPGKTLPGGLPVAVDAEAQPLAELPAQSLAQPSPQPEGVAAKLPAIGKIVIPALTQIAADQAPVSADAAGAEREPPRIEMPPAVAAKFVATELKAKGRSDRAVANDAAETPEPAEDGDAAKDEADTAEVPEESANAISPLPQVVVLAAPQTVDVQPPKLSATDKPTSDEPHPAQARSNAPRGDQMRGDARLQAPASIQIAGEGKPVTTGELPSAGDDAARLAGQKAAAQDAAPRAPKGGPEFRFELSRESGDARTERVAGSQANQIGQARMSLASVSQIVLPEQSAVHGQAADVSAVPVATNPASASFASAQGARPHDFTALVDRLVEARETARAGSVNVAVMHADFGEVSLSFRHDAGGLSVSVANSDPEFARAVSAVTQADGAQNNDSAGQGRREDNTQNSAFSRSGTGGSWGQSSADANMNGGGRQHMRGDSRPEQTAPQSRMHADDERPDRDGIYA